MEKAFSIMLIYSLHVRKENYDGNKIRRPNIKKDKQLTLMRIIKKKTCMLIFIQLKRVTATTRK